jgi:hypothetical protein
MRHKLILFSMIGILAAGAGAADAQKIDANGRCHAANGQFAKAEVCGGASRSIAASKAARAQVITPATAAPPIRSAEKPMCRNDKGKFAKCGSPGAHPS